MKTVLLLLFSLTYIISFADELDTIKTKSTIKEVTVFFDGAQISRNIEVELHGGKALLIIDNLPAELNPKSIQIAHNSTGKVLSVQHDFSYPNNKGKIIEEYQLKVKNIEVKVRENQNQINVFDIEEKILMDNRLLYKDSEGTSAERIKEFAEFYHIKLNEIRQSKLKLTLLNLDLKKQIQNLYIALNKEITETQKIYSKILIAFEQKTTSKIKFDVSYFVTSAGWEPLYDFRVNELDRPLNIIYNANIFQSTGEDWDDVSLTLSSDRPSLNNTKPSLDKWDINRPMSYHSDVIVGSSALQGTVLEATDNEPLPFVNIIISRDGKIITGGASDFDGRFNIKPIKPGYYDIEASFIGYEEVLYKSVYFADDKVVIKDIKLKESSNTLSEVEIVSFKKALIDKGNPSVQSINMNGSRVNRRIRAEKEERREIIIENNYQTSDVVSLAYKIDLPYTILSNGKNKLVKIKEVEKPVDYIYYAVPKLDKDVFLTASLTHWNTLNLLSGHSSIYYKGSFKGQSYIDVENTSDTLEVALTRDRNILIDRKILKEKNEKQYFGKLTKEKINWEITVKNNKSSTIKIVVEDQFPTSENKSVVIERIDASNGKVENRTGKINWELELKPNEKKVLNVIYSVKYPNHMQLKVN